MNDMLYKAVGSKIRRFNDLFMNDINKDLKRLRIDYRASFE